MSLRSATLLLFLIVSTLACGYIMKPPDGDSRPEGWIPLGLNNIRVNRLVISDGWLYACAGKDGLYRIKHPANAGDEWQFLGLDTLDVLNDFQAGVIDIVARDDTLVVGIWARNGGKPEPQGVLRSDDNGKTWEPSDSGMITDGSFASTATIVRLHQSSHDPRILLAGGSRKYAVYISKDFGKSWSVLHEKNALFSTLGINPQRESEIWAGGGTPYPKPILDRSRDSGLTWEQVIEIPQDPNIFDFVRGIAFDPTNVEMVYVCMSWQIMSSNDGGNTWLLSDSLDAGLHDIKLNTTNPGELIACAFDSLYRSTDAGRSWVSFESSPDSSPMQSTAVDWHSRVLYVATSTPLSPTGDVYRFDF